MNPLVNPSTAVLADLYASVAAPLLEVETLLRKELRSDFPDVNELVRYGCLLGGKRLRPALLLLTAQAAGDVRRDHIVLGAVVEMIHTATLIHDDVLDDADMRRHLATVNSRWDNQSSVLLGDFLFTHAFYLASTLETTLACRLIGRATNIVCEGELRQKASRGDFQLDEAAYLSVIESKTAELVACSCQLGAHYAGADESQTHALACYGRELGTAFQIADDLLDLQGAEDETGKTMGTDLDQRILTLPLIHVLTQIDLPRRQSLLELLAGQCHPEQLGEYFDEFDAIAYAQRRAAELATSARGRLECLPASPARDALERIAEFVVNRSS